MGNRWRVPSQLAAASAVILLACGEPAPDPTPAPPATPPTSARAPAQDQPAAPGTPAATPPPSSYAPADDAPSAWTAPLDVPLACGNVRFRFDFNPNATDYSVVNAFWMMWTAERSFTSETAATRAELASIGYTRYASFDDPATGLQALVAGSDRAIVLAFRGSTEIRDWMGNFDFPERPGVDVGVAGRVHRGFASALLPTWPQIERAIDDFGAGTHARAVWVTGHSLGGAMATLAAVRLARSGRPVGALYTFAAPRAGDAAFARDAQQTLGGRQYRFVNDEDIVPRLPPSGGAAAAAASIAQIDFAKRGLEQLLRDLDYAHAGTLFRFDATSHATAFPPMNDDDDVAYWGSLTANNGIVRLLTEQGARHNQLTYLCKMKDLYMAARASDAPK